MLYTLLCKIMYKNLTIIFNYIYSKIHSFFIVMTFRISPENSIDENATHISFNDDDDDPNKTIIYR